MATRLWATSRGLNRDRFSLVSLLGPVGDGWHLLSTESTNNHGFRTIWVEFNFWDYLQILWRVLCAFQTFHKAERGLFEVFGEGRQSLSK